MQVVAKFLAHKTDISAFCPVFRFEDSGSMMGRKVRWAAVQGLLDFIQGMRYLLSGLLVTSTSSNTMYCLSLCSSLLRKEDQPLLG